jgi:Ca2+-binding EF-hand superfamily protein
MLAFMFEQGHYAHKDDVYSFARRFDRDNDSRLQFSDFAEAMTPKDSYYQHQLTLRKPKYIHMKEKDLPKKFYFTDNTRTLLLKVLDAHFHADQRIEIAKKKVARSPTFNIHDAFSAFDVYRQGHLTKENLKSMMQRNGYHINDSESTWLMARFDRRNMGIISY